MSSRASERESSKASDDVLEAETVQTVDAVEFVERIDTQFPSMVGSPSI
ncbi:hypothetical protein [Natrinema sp. 1APR25-10V2]|nr:hypothetical protein [Natrinema sp. 1APR25-10V2]MDS0473560.1 hypothetical protein [Natrinema sp. 1APR25-10V2]